MKAIVSTAVSLEERQDMAMLELWNQVKANVEKKVEARALLDTNLDKDAYRAKLISEIPIADAAMAIEKKLKEKGNAEKVAEELMMRIQDKKYDVSEHNKLEEEAEMI